MSIESSVREALRQLRDREFDNAMTSACITLDATAKNEFGDCTQRFQRFVRGNLDIITYVGFGGAIVACPGATLKLKWPKSPDGCVAVEDIVYKSIRCPLIHEASLPERVCFTEDAFYGERDGVLCIPVNMIYAIVLSVIAAPTNRSRSLGSDFVMTVHGAQLHLECL